MVVVVVIDVVVVVVVTSKTLFFWNQGMEVDYFTDVHELALLNQPIAKQLNNQTDVLPQYLGVSDAPDLRVLELVLLRAAIPRPAVFANAAVIVRGEHEVLPVRAKPQRVVGPRDFRLI